MDACPPDPRHLPPVDPGPLIQAAALLLEAHRFAADLGCDPWEFAVEFGELRAAGLSKSALRWLIRRGYVRRAAEIADPVAPGRAFRPAVGAGFAAELCFT